MRENRILSHVSYLRSLLTIVCSWPPSWSTRNPYRASSGKGALDCCHSITFVVGKAQHIARSCAFAKPLMMVSWLPTLLLQPYEDIYIYTFLSTVAVGMVPLRNLFVLRLRRKGKETRTEKKHQAPKKANFIFPLSYLMHHDTAVPYEAC